MNYNDLIGLKNGDLVKHIYGKFFALVTKPLEVENSGVYIMIMNEGYYTPIDINFGTYYNYWNKLC